MGDAQTGSAGGAGFLRRHRLALPGILAAVILYAMAGFLLAPWVLGRQLVSLARDQLGREAAVQKVEINPFALSVHLQGLQLKDKDGSKLAGVDDLLVNFEAESLFRRAWTFSDLRIAGPYMKVVRDRAGRINLMSLLPPPPATEKPAPAGGLPRFIVRQFKLDKGVIDLEDRGTGSGFKTRIGPFGADIAELSTLPDDKGHQDVAITLESGTRLAWTGDLSLTPLLAEGRATLQGPLFGMAQRYLRDRLKFTVADGSRVDAGAHYRLTGTKDGGIDVAISDIGVTLTDVQLTAPAAPDFLGWKELRVAGGEIHWPANEASVKSVTLTGLKVAARHEADGTINIAELLTPKTEPTPGAASPVAPTPVETPPPAAPEGNGKPWKVKIAEAALQDMKVDLTDAGPTTPATLAVADLDLKLRDVSNEPGTRFPLEASVVLGGGGTIKLQGTVAALPAVALDADLHVDGVRLDQAQPYVSDVARIGIRDGALTIDGHLSSDDKEALAFAGDVRIANLDTRDLVKDQNLLAWSELALDDTQVHLTGGNAKVTRVRLIKPIGRIFIARDKTTNIGDLLVEKPPAQAAARVATTAAGAAPPVKPFKVHIGKILVSDGETDFTDLSLPLPFAARVQDLKGDITTIDSGSLAPSRIAMEGRVDEYGLARVSGQVRISSPTDLADIGVLFQNIEMAPLSPYTVEFAGRKIARGKISLDLHYKLENRHMVGTNKIVIDELELGEKVPNPNAIDLPLGLAVALLKDADGRIDLDMPVTGSLDDPQFGIGSVLWKAFVNLITKIVESPFRLLGSLLGVESEDFGKIEFSPGRSDLLPPEREKLARIAEAMGKRPNLGAEIPAAVDPKADAAALRMAKVQAMVDAELAASGKPDSGRGLEKRTRKAIETLYQRQFPEQSLDAIQQKFQVPPPDEPQGRPRLDELAYLDELRGQIAAAQAIGDDELAALGATRAAAISTELTASGKMAPERVRIGKRKDVTARDGEWVPTELSVGGAAE